MTTITLPRAVLEQALEALKKNTKHLPVDFDYHFEALAALRAALAQQAEEPYAGKAARLNNDRVQVDPVTGNVSIGAEQAEQAWVCPDSPEHRYAKPGHCEDCGKTLVQEQGCDHCNHPLYAATKCRVCGRVTEQAEPLGWAVQIGTHSAGRRQGKPRYVLFFNKADAEDLADRTRGARPEPFYLEGQPSRTVPVYTAPPQRKPLTEEEAAALIELDPRMLKEFGTAPSGTAMELIRAVERAHGIGDSDE